MLPGVSAKTGNSSLPVLTISRAGRWTRQVRSACPSPVRKSQVSAWTLTALTVPVSRSGWPPADHTTYSPDAEARSARQPVYHLMV